jgi:hypothetical protein
MDITLVYEHELFSEERQLPAPTYNLARVLLGKNQLNPVFIPIRSMQYLAIVDDREIAFVDSNFKHLVAIAWTDFQSNSRSSLQEPVQYIARYYRDDSNAIMAQLQSEFPAALASFNSKQLQPQQAKIIRLAGKQDH